MKEFYITDKAENYIEEIEEAINYSVEETKNCYQFRKDGSFKYKVTVECEYHKRSKEDVKIKKNIFQHNLYYS